jgi:hypothetical protein
MLSCCFFSTLVHTIARHFACKLLFPRLFHVSFSNNNTDRRSYAFVHHIS